ncbi:MAG: hypothetical protein PUB35_06280 [Campylobacteraceae bacterium]|uniref:hypothetical protein n=1 Tax=Campylobacter sp. TaxID=205 RepID=UPI002AA7B181|nr:hypothetical protein [Campylobacter sp.]MDD6162377.1 hypothetical protein [Campylobacteraceae bacterium]
MDSPAPYAKDFRRFSALRLEKFGENFRKRYRYGAPRLVLRQNSKKSPRNLGACFYCRYRESRIPREF